MRTLLPCSRVMRHQGEDSLRPLLHPQDDAPAQDGAAELEGGPGPQRARGGGRGRAALLEVEKKSSIESQYAMNIYPLRRVLLLLLDLLLLLNLSLFSAVSILVCSAGAAVFGADVAVLKKKHHWHCT